jgi:DNA-binding GntR family transcriptional regulator
MATTELDDLSGIPRYVQIARVLEAEIRSGNWAPGERAPSRVEIAQRWGVARETAAHAHHWLAERGYLVPVAGVGMVVTPPGRWPEQAE